MKNKKHLYEELFRKAGLPAAIKDHDGREILRSKDFDGSRDEEEFSFSEQEIRCGRICWWEDVSEVERINREIEDIRKKLNEENKITEAENRLAEEKKEFDTEREYFESCISGFEDEIGRLDSLLKGNFAVKFDDRLKKACLIAAYIRQRSLLSLSGKDTGNEAVIPSDGLVNAVGESLDYLKFLVPEIKFDHKGGSFFRLSVLTGCYDWFGKQLELIAENSTSLIAEMIIRKDTVRLRLLSSSGTDKNFRIVERSFGNN